MQPQPVPSPLPDKASAPQVLPAHVGIIMDGNGRWAKNRGLKRSQGHREGLEASKRIVKAARDLGIRYLSLYTFSTENWKRTEDEVSFLMGLLRQHLRAEYDFYRENQIRIVHSGDLERLGSDIIKEIELVMQDTAGFDGLTVNLAINYGGRDEIVRAMRRLCQNLLGSNQADSSLPTKIAQRIADLSQADLQSHLDLPAFPDLDLLIRTGGEMRLSNFLLWQSAYAELVFSDTLWPDWSPDDLKSALDQFSQRNRRFGGTP